MLSLLAAAFVIPISALPGVVFGLLVTTILALIGVASWSALPWSAATGGLMSFAWFISAISNGSSNRGADDSHSEATPQETLSLGNSILPPVLDTPNLGVYDMTYEGDDLLRPCAWHAEGWD